MKEKTYIAYKIGERVPESGKYECVACEDLGMKKRLFLKEGDNFPECSSCGKDALWKWSKITFPSFISPHYFHRN